MTGIIYARYSSDNQREESIDGQIRECKEFAEKNDIRIIDTYIDRALSAKTDNRPSFQQMIKDSSKGLFDVIIVWKLDRFARNRYDSAHYKNILKKNGVKVISATEAISSGAEGILLESMLEGYAEYYSAELAEKINRGLTENALKCKYNGGSVAFGYMIDDDQHFKINPTLAPVVLNIFNDYISGKTQKEIRDKLNNKGLKNANGREFTINNISKILTNRRYVGNYIYKDVVIENGIPAIVPNDVFDKVQEMIATNKRAPSRHKAVDDYLLTTKLYCGKCKSFMVGESENARGRRYSYYKCVSTKLNKTCDKKAVKKDWIEDIVIYQVMKFIDDDLLAVCIATLTGNRAGCPAYNELQLRRAKSGPCKKDLPSFAYCQYDLRRDFVGGDNAVPKGVCRNFQFRFGACRICRKGTQNLLRRDVPYGRADSLPDGVCVNRQCSVLYNSSRCAQIRFADTAYLYNAAYNIR